jgi:hypothetical protein
MEITHSSPKVGEEPSPGLSLELLCRSLNTMKSNEKGRWEFGLVREAQNSPIPQEKADW